MTTKEAIFELCAIYVPSGNVALINENTHRAIEMAIDALSKSSLPSGLDEAAEKYADSMGLKDFDKVRTISDFKACAEWMAGQDKEKIEQAFFSGYNECEERMKKEFEKRAMTGEVNNTGYPTTIQLHTFDSSLKNGEKVNIIIIKQEQD